MKGLLLFSDKQIREDGTIIEVVAWSVPEPVPPSSHGFKYRLFYGRPGERIVGYDNERGKGDHKHILGHEEPYRFVSIDRLIEDFRDDIERISGKRP